MAQGTLGIICHIFHIDRKIQGILQENESRNQNIERTWGQRRKRAMSSLKFPIQGSCGCGHVRYQLHYRPIFIQCCNCQQCQREAGSGFAIYALIEFEEVTTTDALKHIIMPSESGHGQAIARCPRCFVAVWSYYSHHRPHLKFVRVVTLERIEGAEEFLRPDAFIFTKFKMPWTEVPEYARAEGRVFEEYYDESTMYSKEGYERFQAAEAKGREWRAGGRNWSDLGEVSDLRQS